MSASFPILVDREFRRYITISAALHVALVLALTIKVYVFPDETLSTPPAMRVDLIALPEKLPEAPAFMPKAPEAPPSKEVAKPEAKEKTVVLNTKKTEKVESHKNEAHKIDSQKKEKNAFEKLKQLDAIDKLSKQVESEHVRQATATFKGNQISKGSELRGLTLLQHDSYVSDVGHHIRRFWSIPQLLANKKLRTTVRVKFDEFGNITDKQILQSSGNSSFDDAVISTLEKASPVPKPPDKFQRLVALEGILVGFPE
ncbi:MAG: hypothetical protein C5B49_13150 [Bdellovibrio sp.]|nr:MAG: hypothetical protein C5B49_13150 [Bdellovibrio sp.]